jgi:hypothetical protein
MPALKTAIRKPRTTVAATAQNGANDAMHPKPMQHPTLKLRQQQKAPLPRHPAVNAASALTVDAAVAVVATTPSAKTEQTVLPMKILSPLQWLWPPAKSRPMAKTPTATQKRHAKTVTATAATAMVVTAASATMTRQPARVLTAQALMALEPT